MLTEILQTEYGRMICAANDINQTNALRKTGKACDFEEIELLKTFINKKNFVFVDVGANLGMYTLGLAKIITENFGTVYSFEPQRILYYMLCGSIVLNDYENIFCYNKAVGDTNGEIDIPNFDYTKPLNFGSIEFTNTQKEKLSQNRAESKEKVEIITLDGFLKLNRLDFIKIDVEGMEINVLNGAKQLISKYKPIMFVEHLKNDRKRLTEAINDLGYKKIKTVGANFLCEC
jgi:FkbM family methyltransferase